MPTTANKISLVPLLFVPCMAANAVELHGRDIDFMHDAGYVEMGPVRFYPMLDTSLGYDSNIFESARNTVSSRIARVVPEVAAVLPMDSGFVQLGAQADDQRFINSSADNETDTTVYLRGAAAATYRNHLDFDVSQENSHEARGTGLTEGFDPLNPVVAEPDRFTDRRAALRYRFGADGARGNLRIGADFLDHSYDNHRDRTRYFDRDEYGIGATFLLRMFARTALAIEARERRIEYDETKPLSAALDSRQHSILLGVEWKPTGKTSGSLRVGHLRKNFDDPARVDGSNTVWELSTTWHPRSYSKVEMSLQRTPNETNGSGDFIDTRNARIAWTNDWTSRVGTTVAVTYMRRQYANADRESRTKGAEVGFSYRMRRWLEWKLIAAWHNRNSNVDELDFERNRYWLTAEITL